MLKLPQEYLCNMKQLLQDEYDAYIDSFNNDRVYSLRVNTNKISVKDFLNINPFNLTPIPWTSDGFYYEPTDNVTKHPYYYAGLYYVQEASAMLPAEVLPINENDNVLDACAAPGGKSSKLANKLNGTGLLISNDISVSRAQVLLKTLESQGISNMFVLAEDINNLDRFSNYFDKILIDAPCSGEGMFRKDDALIKNWNIDSNEYYASIQKKIIEKAIDLLKPNGQLVYSTCTFSPLEDEQVIEHALNYNRELQLLPIKMYKGFKNGLTEKTKNCVRLYPHLIKGEGHFVALLQKGNEPNINSRQDNLSYKPNIEFFNNLNYVFKNGEYVNRENKIYYQPKIDINTSGLRILRSGLYLGEYKHDKFEPSHSLAMAIKASEYNKIINFNLDDNRVIKYLKCETLDVKEKHIEGYVLVCVDNFPLGFGLVNKGILKNKLPANYRYI